jgi:hypothetical protein
MAAGQGFKTFTTGEVLTAGDVNGYLMQGINVFADATARDAAITAPAEGQFAFTKDNNSLWYYDGAAWVASGATGDIEGVTVTSPLTGGGTSGTVTVGILSGTTSNLGAVQLSDSTSSTSTTLAATANAVKTTYDLATTANTAAGTAQTTANAAIPKSTVTTAGDIIYATGASTVTRAGIGSTGQILTVSGGVPVWASPAGGGGMTLLSTTTLSGASTTISSISQDYVNLFLIVNGVNFNGVSRMAIEPNGVIDNADWAGIKYVGATTTTQGSNATDIVISNGENVISSNTNNNWAVLISGYTGTTYKKLFQWTGNFIVDSSSAQARVFGFGNSLNNNAITSLEFKNAGGSFNAGTVKIYGVK